MNMSGGIFLVFSLAVRLGRSKSTCQYSVSSKRGVVCSLFLLPYEFRLFG